MQASYSIDENLYHTSYESGMLEDPMVSPPPEMFKMTVDPRKVGGQTAKKENKRSKSYAWAR